MLFDRKRKETKEERKEGRRKTKLLGKGDTVFNFPPLKLSEERKGRERRGTLSSFLPEAIPDSANVLYIVQGKGPF